MKRRKNHCFAMIMLGMSMVLSGCNGTEQKDSQKWEEIMTEVVEAVSDETGVTEHGFTWGGNWKSLKDYQHFEKK